MQRPLYVYRSKKFVREFTLIVIYTYKAVTFLRRMEENTPPFIIRSWEREILLLLSSVIAITLWHSSYEGPRLKARLIINGQIYLTVKRADTKRAGLSTPQFSGVFEPFRQTRDTCVSPPDRFLFPIRRCTVKRRGSAEGRDLAALRTLIKPRALSYPPTRHD